MTSCQKEEIQVSPSEYDLAFHDLSLTWDEGIPLGNSILGSLIWEKDNSLRMSLDRIDLWDLRPTDSLSGPNFRYDWVYRQVLKKDYYPVQKKLDHPYDQLPAPAKIPGAGLEFSLSHTGKPDSVRLYLNNALCEVFWKNGMKMQSFVHSNEPVGWFRIQNAEESFIPELIPPLYADDEDNPGEASPVTGQDLRRLGYTQGKVIQEDNKISYHQKGWGDFYYDVVVKWEKKNNEITGVWSITSSLSEDKAEEMIDKALERGINTDYQTHMTFWNNFWDKSSVQIPDPVLARQYANEIYKLGSTAREYSYPISLQAVWTADNGKLPPWKGDYHHDLNTQLSYWPCYTGNYLTEGLGYLNTLWDQKETNKEYTKTYFEKEGLNVPGVATLTGEPMGGWIQYSLSPTVSAWLAQHFYLHYKYSADKDFLKEKAYPYIKDVAVFLEEITYLNENGQRQLPISSSPEIFDNSVNAWFQTLTNYDLSLIRFIFKAAAELASDLTLTEEASHWNTLMAQMPAFDTDEQHCLTFAQGVPYSSSHRHFSHAMAIHPLGLIDWSHGEKDQKIIQSTINRLDSVGPDYWVGYSYSWLGNMKARARDGKGAAEALRTFAECFCLRNTFHANGDQSKTGKSLFTYRPFTLEGNFAFASGIQEMLIQSHTGVIHLFPAIPLDWEDVSFKNMRTYGAFLISAKKRNGEVKSVGIESEKGGMVQIKNPFNKEFIIHGRTDYIVENDIIELNMQAGERVILELSDL
ncbi:MAG: hypothetical protein LIO93_11700 [Bacteroidales bacterium]|nr:hypothetical protein [Bacteroidales bacterium]